MSGLSTSSSASSSASEPESDLFGLEEAGEVSSPDVVETCRGRRGTVTHWVNGRKPWKHFQSRVQCVLRKICRCCACFVDSIWSTGARLVILDFTMAYTWSTALTFVSFLTASLAFAEAMFDSISLLPSCESCRAARTLRTCTIDGGLEPTDRFMFTVNADPIEGQEISLTRHQLMKLLTVALVRVANSR
eukprot:TRINITY_DN94176_c0_g1_i1.p1 TRINITY_DN94176_c0_g1~~TRINITY_DN94176_c0_g1_i1.p1  ORF type:complete len:190 (+),score=10.44 TRINITY_DN94176_c0_g1_i1:54-623(+)